MVNINLINSPITVKDYKIYDVTSLPRVILGIRVKNKFDEQRLDIKSKYTPRFISHFETNNELEPVYFYGIEIKPKLQYKNLLYSLNYSTQNGTVDCITWYRELLEEFNLTCDTCYRYLSNGVYPIDVKHLNDVSRRDYKQEMDSGFLSMLKSNTNKMTYDNITNFNLLVLGYSTGYNTDYRLNTH